MTPGINWSAIGGPDHRRAPLQPYWIDKENYYKAATEAASIGIMEFPVTIFGKRFGVLGKILPDTWLFYRWLRPTHMTVLEQKRIMKDICGNYAEPVFVMLFHSMEIMINKTPFVRNRLMQKRFLKNLEAIIRYAAAGQERRRRTVIIRLLHRPVRRCGS